MRGDVAAGVRKKRERFVDQIIARAVERRVMEARRGRPGGKAPGGFRSSVRLTRVLRRALGIRTANAISIRPKSSAGRPFYFRYYAAGRAVTLKIVGHQIYVERDEAIERAYKDSAGWERELVRSDRDIDRKETIEVRRRTSFDEDQLQTSAVHAQAYIEDPIKVVSSFGNIGDTASERCEFWRLLDEHEPHPDKRSQMRIIAELPHETTPEARAEIVERFISFFKSRNLPYFAVIHAPTAQNDTRNFHVHILCSERPAVQKADPATGALQWDFAITETVKTPCRHTVRRYPFRQRKCADLRRRSAPKELRELFARTVNEVMAEREFNVRFDPRSYRAAGHDLPKLRALKRGECRAVKRGQIALEDSAWRARVTIAEENEIQEKFAKSSLAAAHENILKLEKAGHDVEAINAILPTHYALPNGRNRDWQSWDGWLADAKRALEDGWSREAEHICEISAIKTVIGASKVRGFKVKPGGGNAFTPEQVEDLEFLESVAETMAAEATQAYARDTNDFYARKGELDRTFERAVNLSTVNVSTFVGPNPAASELPAATQLEGIKIEKGSGGATEAFHQIPSEGPAHQPQLAAGRQNLTLQKRPDIKPSPARRSDSSLSLTPSRSSQSLETTRAIPKMKPTPAVLPPSVGRSEKDQPSLPRDRTEVAALIDLTRAPLKTSTLHETSEEKLRLPAFKVLEEKALEGIHDHHRRHSLQPEGHHLSAPSTMHEERLFDTSIQATEPARLTSEKLAARTAQATATRENPAHVSWPPTTGQRSAADVSEHGHTAPETTPKTKRLQSEADVLKPYLDEEKTLSHVQTSSPPQTQQQRLSASSKPDDSIAKDIAGALQEAPSALRKKAARRRFLMSRRSDGRGL